MWPNLISCHSPIRKQREKGVDNTVDQGPAVLGIGRRAARVIGREVGQQLSRQALRVLGCVAACAFQFVREDANEAIIVRWPPAEVRLLLLSGEEDRL